MSGRLAGKAVLVTGAAAGIGRASALLFAREGAAVAAADIDEAGGEALRREIDDTGGSAIFIPADMGDQASIEAMFAAAARRFGRIHCAFNNAGVVDGSRSLLTSTQDNWDRVMSVNLEGVWRCMKLEIDHMLECGGGAIVNMASRAGLVGVPSDAVYGASKHGVIGLTKAAAVEFASRGVRINAVCPGTVDTPLLRKRFGDLDQLSKTTNPLGRIADPHEIAEAAAWLLSDAASFVVGIAMPVDGGATAR